MRVYPNPYSPPTPEHWARIEPVARRLLQPITDAMGRKGLALIAEESREFKALKIKRHPQILGLDHTNTPLAAVISYAPPDLIAEPYGSFADTIAAGQALHNGAALLYGLQTSIDRYRHAEAAAALIAAEPTMKFLFQYDQWLVQAVGNERMDRLMLESVASMNPKYGMLVWLLLEHHDPWSQALSAKVIEIVASTGAESRARWLHFGGNGFAENLHPSLIPQAIEALKPWAKDQPNAKRWTKKLRARAKSLAAELP